MARDVVGVADYADIVTETTDPSPDDSTPASDATSASEEAAQAPKAPAGSEPAGKKRSVLRETAILASIAVVLYYLMLTFVARPYLIPSESMEPTLHGCPGCVGDRIMVDKVSYRFGSPQPGDVIVFRGPPSWNYNYKSIRSHNAAVRGLQNALSVVGFVPPDENDLVKRVIAVGDQTVQCRADTGLTVDDKPLTEPYLNPRTMMADPAVYPCLGGDFGPVTIPAERVWVMGDNRTHSADSRAHCTNSPEGVEHHILCTGDPMAGTVPLSNVIGKARFIAWPPMRWGGIGSINPQQGP